MKPKQPVVEKGHLAVAHGLSLPISTKHCIEICNAIRYRSTGYAKRYLEEVSVLKRAVPVVRSTKDRGHKAGMSAGRFPQKAAKEFLRLLRGVEANAQYKGLDSSNLKIIKVLANKASIPRTGGRHGHKTKRTNLEIEVRGMAGKKAEHAERKEEKKAEEKKTEIRVEAKTTASAPHIATPHTTVPHTSTTSTTNTHSTTANKPFTTLSSAAKPSTVKPVVKETMQTKETVHEPSSEELLRQVQAKAAQLNQMNKSGQYNSTANKSIDNVENLYEELQKKGTLRGKK